jgi:hypothetical protein
MGIRLRLQKDKSLISEKLSSDDIPNFVRDMEELTTECDIMNQTCPGILRNCSVNFPVEIIKRMKEHRDRK